MLLDSNVLDISCNTPFAHFLEGVIALLHLEYSIKKVACATPTF